MPSVARAISELTISERVWAVTISTITAVIGLLLSAAGGDDPIALHGGILMVLGIGGVLAIGSGFYTPEPGSERREQYFDTPIRFGLLASMAWAVFGLFVGDWVAWLLVFPDMITDVAALSFGRIRPVHTTSVIFGFGGNALVATSFFVLQRTCRTRLPDQLTPWLVILAYNVFCLLSVMGYMAGITRSKEYAEPEWHTNILLLGVWVIYFSIFVRTLRYRAEQHIYVANWYYMAFVLVVGILHVVNGLSLPVSLGHAKSYGVFAGVQDAMVQWWYGHNAVAFFLTSGFLGMMYYYLPKRAGRPIYSYRTSIISFWGITFFYIWVGSHHLHHTALPHWVQTLGMTFSIMLLVPSWASAGNALMTLNGAWHKVRDDAVLRFMMVAAVFYGLSTFEGSFLAIRAVNSLSHYTDWTVGHVHAGALGWVAMITFGAIYATVPILWKKPGMYSDRMVEAHFWLAVSGTVLYVMSMWNAGITQGLMWRTYSANGALTFSFLDSIVTMQPYYVARALGGLMFLIGAVLGSANIYLTIKRPTVDVSLTGRIDETPPHEPRALVMER